MTHATDPADLAEVEGFAGVGSLLAGKYRVERVLGVGGMGVVVAAHHEQLHERVAIKFLLPRAGQNERLAARFLREARTASKLKSPHVARVFDVDTRLDGTPFIVMEYLEGETLAARFRRDRELSRAAIVDDVLEACVALAEAHALGIVHRDLKPANLFAAESVTGLASVRVLDFGISKVIEPRPNADVITQDLPIGSPPYMSPEQLTQPASVDLRTDIWSLGVVLYEGLTGNLPFPGDSFAEVSASVLQRAPEPLGERPELEPILSRCLAKDRERRFPSISSLAEALLPYAGPRGARAMALLETWRRRARVSEPVVELQRPEIPTATASEVRENISTATGTVAPTHAPSTTRAERRPLLFVGIATLIALVLALLVRAEYDRGSIAPASASLASSTANRFEGSVSAASMPSGVPVPAPLPEPASHSLREGGAAPSAAASGPVPQLRSRDNARPKQKLGRGGGEGRPFDPVYDERR